MANEYSADVPKGFNVPKQVRLDSITGVQNELTLKNLGTGNNLAFKYYEGLKVYCKDEKTEYVWREVIGSETGLLDTAFTYPTYSPVDGIDYSGKSFNFFQTIISNNTFLQNNFVRKLEIPSNLLNGFGSIEQQICDYILNLPEKDRTIAETDSKWNIVITNIPTLKSFNISTFANGESGYSLNNCPPTIPPPINNIAYHNGIGLYPIIGDTIYENFNGTILHRNGKFLYFNGEYNDVIIITSGISIEVPPLNCE